MGLLVAHAGRVFARRTPQYQQKVLSPVAKRQKSSAGEKSSAQLVKEGNSVVKADDATILPFWQRLGPLSKGFNAYDGAQTKRPYVTQVASSLVIYLCGDLSAQKLGGDEYNPWRTLRNMTIGCISSLPSYRWFMYLGKSFNYSSTTLSLAIKVVVNQIVFAPIFNTYFFGMSSLLAGDSFDQVWKRIRDTVPTSVFNSLKLWPAVTAFNFTYVQPQYRALFAGFIAIGWQSYLSWLNQRAAIAERSRRSFIVSDDEIEPNK